MAVFLFRVMMDRLTSLSYKNSKGDFSGSHFKGKYNHKYSQRSTAVDSCLLLVSLLDLFEVQQLSVLSFGRTESCAKLEISFVLPHFGSG